MQIQAYPKEFFRLARLHRSLISPAATERLRWITAWQQLRLDGYSAQTAASLLQLPRASLYRWQGRLQRSGKLSSLEFKSRRPKRLRKPAWRPELVQAVLALRKQYPRWGKEKLLILLKGRGSQLRLPP